MACVLWSGSLTLALYRWSWSLQTDNLHSVFLPSEPLSFYSSRNKVCNYCVCGLMLYLQLHSVYTGCMGGSGWWATLDAWGWECTRCMGLGVDWMHGVGTGS